MRLVFACITLLGFALLFAHSAGWVALGVVMLLGGGIATGFAIAHRRIASHARDEELNSYELDQLRRQAKREDDPLR
ncbi:hypothetical protein [Oleiagrimonas sp. C23AA]|uniref:hypothetical protein n=1 Tax=Oleiagrimonas sp. C23AA TaxID=2719047 RepID=UPI001420DEA2|nr:hypothetical protein [Oleiagrimonas sp. C23AA]NII10677.1 hypothetical protein [Oleiagrimonas sp. C23AA]